MSRVLVTGGAGYIGSHAVQALRAQGTRVVVFDNLSGYREATQHESAVVVGDIHDTARLRATIREHDVDAVMHFAAWLPVTDLIVSPASRWREAHPHGCRKATA